MAIEIRSFNQQLGDMIRKIIAETPLTDINAGSVLLSLLEACVANDFENSTAILNVLQLFNIDAVSNNDLDARAADYGLTRKASVKASGQVTLFNTNISKRSSGLYVIKPAPIAGQTTIYVNNTTGWAPTGAIYIGRGTQSFEGPISYTAITVFPTYSAITLSSALQKDHLISDLVIDSQGQPDNIITAGTAVKIPANSQNPEVQYVTLRDAVIPSGEDSVTGVDVIAIVAGSLGNAQINTITQFDTSPFSGAAVANTSAFSNGRDIETDTELRNRIKSYSASLARGTPAAIIAAILNVSDSDDSKQVASAIMTEPASVDEPSILYIDDGAGFQPSYAGQSVDQLLANATGKEEFLQLANFPLPRPQVVNVAQGPYLLINGMFLNVTVDGVQETIQFEDTDFLNIAAATTAEVIVAINSKSTLFKARFTNNSQNILLYPVEHSAEIIQVIKLSPNDDALLYANSILKFPTDEFSYIALYQNSTRLKETAKNAILETVAFAQWNVTSTSDIVLSVDGTPAQDRSFAVSDFPGASSFASLTLNDWVTAFNGKFAGITAQATPSQTMLISSNKVGSASALELTGGTLLNKLFSNKPLTSQGQSAQFELNRQTGNLRILTDIVEGDNISAGVEDAKGFVVSSETSSGTYNVGSDTQGRPAEMVVVTDAAVCDQRSIPLLVGTTITISDQGSNVERIMSSSASTFASLLPGDYLYIISKSAGWLSSTNTGIFRIVNKGAHTSAGVDSYIEVLNNTIVVESASVSDSLDIKAFVTDGYPQVWRGTFTGNPPAASISDIVTSLNDDLLGVKTSIFKSNSIKITSATENDGSIAIPVSMGFCSALFQETQSAQLGNPSHIANRVSDKDLVSFFRRTAPVSTNVWLDRQTYVDVKGPITSNANPDVTPYSGTYSETVESTGKLNNSNLEYNDILSFTRGNNRNQFRNIKAFIAVDKVGTQQGTARTLRPHIVNDEFQAMRSLELSADDSVVIIMDDDATNNTVDVKLARTGRVNSGSGVGSFTPTTTEFSANDYDNESTIDFSNITVWGTSANNTDFSDYAVWSRARNWYASGGTGSGLGKMILRANAYGPNGETIRFSTQYPTVPNQTATTLYENTPSYTSFAYYFGSGPARAAAIINGTTIAVKGPYPTSTTNFPNGVVSSGNYFDYTFSAGNLASVTVGDVLSMSSTSGVGSANRGEFGIVNLNGLTVRVFNPAASLTTPGTPEIDTITTIADVVGTPTTYTVTTVADVAGSLDGTYFIVYDTIGSVAVWFDLDNNGTPEPPHGAYRSIKVANALTGSSANSMASAIYQTMLLDGAFNVFAIGNQVTITNKQNGALANGSAGTSGFTVIRTPGTNNVSITGKYFTIYDEDGSVAVWYDVNNQGTHEPFHGARRSIRVSSVNFGDNANTVAAATASQLSSDAKFTASALANVVTVTHTTNGNVGNATTGTSGFGVSSTDGTLGTSELITNASGLSIFPLNSTDVTTICSTINNSALMTAVPVGSGSLTISVATKEDIYSYTGNATALAYGHNPTNSVLRTYVGLYDSENWIKSFQNANPNFTTKRAFTLNGISSIYVMDTTPNPGTSDLGELFKLIPTSVKNVHHHLTQKALSQLPIIANVDITDDRKNVQIRSKQLGSAGAVEFVGGTGNKQQTYVLGDSEVTLDTSGNQLLVRVPAFPDTFGAGDTVLLQNDAGVKRLSRLGSNDTISVLNPSSGVGEYTYDPKTINVTSGTTFTITDVSASYSRPSGFVWRWTHGGGATFADVVAGDSLLAFGTLTGWDQGNKARTAGDGFAAGLPIVAVNDSSNYIDVVNPYGLAMGSTAVGASSTVQICPTPAIKWNLAHAARTVIVSLVRSSNVITATCESAHGLHNGDNIDLIDSNNISDGIYASITVTGTNTFTFTNAGSNFTETNSDASVLKSGLVASRYRLEHLGFNNMMRLSRHDGQSPRFTDCGVAVDDYLLIGGSTFKSNNNGRFRVLAVDNDSIIYLNEQGTDELDTVIPFNRKDLLVTWTANSDQITGVAGAFKHLQVGNWVKKVDDKDSLYLQVISMNASAASATLVTLGGPYQGATNSALGVSYNEATDHDKGIILQNVDDISAYEGDSVVAGDSLFVQNIVNASWFNVNNIGTFDITEWGTKTNTYKPFVRVNNTNAAADPTRAISVNTAGFYIVESLANKFYTIRQIKRSILDDINSERRAIYITPHSRSYKFNSSNNTSITHMGKLGYNTDVTQGIDGYLYYTGLLRRVQRIVDGYEPDPENFPGMKAAGSIIETLPPLIKVITLAINITTNSGVNLGDISNNIKSVIINYVAGLGVGEDVILSQIVANVMQIKGVAAVTFTNPVPSTERITLASNEKATISPNDISIA